MARIQRTPPEPIAPPAGAPRRMMRVTNPGRDVAAQDKKLQAIENHLQLIAIAQDKIDYLKNRIQPDINKEQAEIDRLKVVLEAELKAAKLPGYTNGKWEARWVQSMGKSTREIDVVKVQKALPPADFLKVVKVLVTDLKTVMSQREIDNVSTVTPGVPGPSTFIVQPVDIKKAK